MGISCFNNPLLGPTLRWITQLGISFFSSNFPQLGIHSHCLSPVGYSFILSIPSWVFIYTDYPQLGIHSHCLSPVGYSFTLFIPSWVFIHIVYPQLGIHLHCLSPVGYSFTLSIPSWVFIYIVIRSSFSFPFSCTFSLRNQWGVWIRILYL